MFKEKKVIVVMPAYNAAQTLQKTYDEVMAQGIVDMIILVDDASQDDTAEIAKTLPNVEVCIHDRNRGYGANQKTCYRLALERGGDIIIMVHPDYQYTPMLIPAHGSPHREWSVLLCLGFEDTWRICPEGRDAALEICC